MNRSTVRHDTYLSPDSNPYTILSSTNDTDPDPNPNSNNNPYPNSETKPNPNSLEASEPFFEFGLENGKIALRLKECSD